MRHLTDLPRFLFLVSFVVLWLAAEIGVFVGRRFRIHEDSRDDFDIILAATLTLLGLIIGFSFSMATSRYDLRKNYEEAEANAIGTEYVRAGLLPSDITRNLQDLLGKYLSQRILFYTTYDKKQLAQVNAYTATLQGQLWVTVENAAVTKPTPLNALVASGMNDVLNSQSYTQAAWLNRIPAAAWKLMVAIALCCNFLLGYGARKPWKALLLILPLVLAIAFFLIADIDSPGSGVIRVMPENLISLSRSLH